ncbi:MAG: MutT domain protein-like [uncultured Sulfurovum sp.]|uniref:MutT domain protein-like n=1 Tax=uncultured Sulfurovum sp. TaxID=269237 RepID=A0A6S6SYN2_9BACT|nr:MAG: MutT domain protein-like [uncultured Sulfurovum sp.]
MLSTKEDKYNGLIVETESIETSVLEFKSSLEKLLESSKAQKKALLWIDLQSEQAEHIAIALQMGFDFHNCEAKRTTLTFQVTKNAYIPVPPTHTIGVGAVVINNKNELLMVRDRIHTSHSIYKLPGGMLEHAQSLEEGVVREVWEETGIKAKLIKMVSVLNSHPFTFNKSNMYVVFQLEAENFEINVVDTHEIEFALWMPLEEFFAHEEMSDFQKNLVDAALNHDGISLTAYEHKLPHKKHVEVYS